MISLLFLLLPIAAVSGWYTGYKKEKVPKKGIPSDYLRGLNYLIDEKPDKAIEIFIKMLEVNSDTVETHLALGSLFRRRGEVDRAIHIHQNLISRPILTSEQRSRALSELGQDYLRAGLLDRAESVFLELNNTSVNVPEGLRYLLDIYQLQKDWSQAIAIASKLEMISKNTMKVDIAHFYCELAEEAISKGDLALAENDLRSALDNDKRCARASILYGRLASERGEHKQAIKHYMRVEKQDSHYLSEVVIPLMHCYEHLGLLEELVEYLQRSLTKCHNSAIILVLADVIAKLQGIDKAMEFLAEEMQKHLSLRGVIRLLDFYIESAKGDLKKNLDLLLKFLHRYINSSPRYLCLQCGFASKLFYWQCPSCRKWSRIEPIEDLGD